MAKDEKGQKNLEEMEWYHGYRPRKDIMNLLKEPGDFLVRATETGPATEIVLSVCGDNKKVINLTLKFEDSKWRFGVGKQKSDKLKKLQKFDTVVQLVEHYQKNGHITKTIPMKRPVARPRWLIKHDQCSFDKTKDLLGSGNFCHVYKGKYTRKPDDVVTVAIKICHQGTQQDNNHEEAKEARQAMIHEAQLMSYYAHDHVIQLFGVACDHPPILVVMEFCPGGNLENHLKLRGPEISDGEKISYAYESARGMRYLHTKHCVHRDLAARNCLISEKGVIKIADFGMSKLMDEIAEEANNDVANAQIPLRWMAPESLKKPITFSMKTDIWSFGVLLYEIFNDGEKPWPKDPPKFIATEIRRGRMPALPKKTPAKVKDLVAKMWRLDPAERPSFTEIFGQLQEIHAANMPPAPEKWVINKIDGVVRVQQTAGEESVENDDMSSRYSTDEGDRSKQDNIRKKKKSSSGHSIMGR